MIKINLYDYQRVAQEVTVQKMIMTVIFILLVFLGLTGLSFMNDQRRVDTAQKEEAEAQARVNGLKGQYDAVQKLKADQGALQGKIKGLENLRSAVVPFARLLEDVGDIIPQGVWLDNMKQVDQKNLKSQNVPILFLDPEAKPKPGGKKGKNATKEKEVLHQFIQFNGQALSDRGVVLFMEGLERLDYLDHVIMHKSVLDWIGLDPVRKYTVYAHVVGSGPA